MYNFLFFRFHQPWQPKPEGSRLYGYAAAFYCNLQHISIGARASYSRQNERNADDMVTPHYGWPPG